MIKDNEIEVCEFEDVEWGINEYPDSLTEWEVHND
jgi:hypothetical protein